ncbi:MAG: hypothetical protein HYX59_16435 [Elusimicrobia bacterium]|nr:hypothetical protein [Elusimicrobiota bacterium]
MRIFPPDEEERAFRHERLRDWRAAGLLRADKAVEAEALAGEAPAHASWPLRVLLFGFGALALGALSALALKDLQGRVDSAFVAWVLAGVAVAAAEAGIRSLKVRRFGAEEALVAGAVLLVAYGAERAFSNGTRWHFSTAIFSATLALGACTAYLRYGYRLASFGAAVALGVFVGSLEYGERATRVMLAVLYAVLLALATWWPGLERRERERLEIVRFFLALSVPLCLNLRLEKLFYSWAPQPATDAFGLATFAAIFLIPLFWLVWGALDRSRTLLWAGAVGLLVAQCSVKPYLGLTRNAWDPAVLGLELMILALVLKRWLDAGPGARRGAYSSEALGDPGPGAAAGLLASVVAASPSSPPAGPDRPKGGGGSFGGGGASGGY